MPNPKDGGNRALEHWQPYHLTQHNIPENSGLHVDIYIVKSNCVLRLGNSHHLTQLSS